MLSRTAIRPFCPNSCLFSLFASSCLSLALPHSADAVDQASIYSVRKLELVRCVQVLSCTQNAWNLRSSVCCIDYRVGHSEKTVTSQCPCHRKQRCFKIPEWRSMLGCLTTDERAEAVNLSNVKSWGEAKLRVDHEKLDCLVKEVPRDHRR